MPNYTFDKKRPLSWSSISSFEYNPEKWFESYILGKKESSREMDFGSLIDRRLQDDPTFLPDVVRYPILQHRMAVMFGKIPLIGYADGFDREGRKLLDYKTGKNPWTQKKADETGQLSAYCLMLFISEKIKPEEMDLSIIWLPTQENGDFTISLIEPCKPQTFHTKRSMADILTFGARINRVYAEMQTYVQNHE